MGIEQIRFPNKFRGGGLNQRKGRARGRGERGMTNSIRGGLGGVVEKARRIGVSNSG